MQGSDAICSTLRSLLNGVATPWHMRAAPLAPVGSGVDLVLLAGEPDRAPPEAADSSGEPRKGRVGLGECPRMSENAVRVSTRSAAKSI